MGRPVETDWQHRAISWTFDSSVASRDFVRQHPDLACPEDLLDLPLLHGGPFQSEWHCWLKVQGVSVPEKMPGIHCLHSHMIIPTVKLGRGVMLGSRVIVERDIAHDELVELKVPGVKPASIGAYVFVAREDRWSTPAIAKLRKFLAERMRPLGAPGKPKGA